MSKTLGYRPDLGKVCALGITACNSACCPEAEDHFIGFCRGDVARVMCRSRCRCRVYLIQSISYARSGKLANVHPAVGSIAECYRYRCCPGSGVHLVKDHGGHACATVFYTGNIVSTINIIGTGSGSGDGGPCHRHDQQTSCRHIGSKQFLVGSGGCS